MFAELFKRRSPRASGPGPDRLATSVRDFTPAKILWRQASTKEVLEFELRVYCMKTFQDSIQAELGIDAHGVLIGATVYLQNHRLTVYLGNEFWVPQQLKRKGLGLALISAMVDAFYQAAFGSSVSEKRVFLQGFFVNEGEQFATAVCSGITPTKAKPAEINTERLLNGRKSIRFVTWPTQISQRP